MQPNENDIFGSQPMHEQKRKNWTYYKILPRGFKNRTKINVRKKKAQPFLFRGF